MKIKYTQSFLLGIILIALFVLMSVLSPSEFLKVANIQSMLAQMPEFGIIALGMMVVVLSGGIDLSIISSGALASIVGALFMKQCVLMGVPSAQTIVIGIVAILASAALCGSLNGFMVGYLKLSPILVTLGTMSLFGGIALNITNGASVAGFPPEFMALGTTTLAGVPLPMIIFVLIVVLLWLYLCKTPSGMYIYMVGSNKTALVYSGVNVKKVLMKTMMLAALLSGLAFILMISRYNSAKVSYGESYLMKSIAAVVLGGTAISGGEGKISGTVLAVAILQVLSTGLNMLLINGHIADVIIGCILIAVLGINQYVRKIKEKKNILKMSQVIGRLG